MLFLNFLSLVHFSIPDISLVTGGPDRELSQYWSPKPSHNLILGPIVLADPDSKWTIRISILNGLNFIKIILIIVL